MSNTRALQIRPVATEHCTVTCPGFTLLSIFPGISLGSTRAMNLCYKSTVNANALSLWSHWSYCFIYSENISQQDSMQVNSTGLLTLLFNTPPICSSKFVHSQSAGYHLLSYPVQWCHRIPSVSTEPSKLRRESMEENKVLHKHAWTRK